jgi:hypothetical protein
MSLLDPPRCPNCNSEIALKNLWDAAPKTRGGSAIVRQVGIACPTCGVPLKVLQGRLLLSLFLTYIVPFVIVLCVVLMTRWDDDRLRRLVTLGALFVTYFAAFRLHRHLIPRLLGVRLIGNNERVEFPLAKPAEAAEKTPEAAMTFPLAPTDEDGPAWKCKFCGEENPSNFNECWKCLTMRETGSISPSGPL